ncbi:MAG: 30S ribosomal protein S7 [Bacteroidales bacterium]|mgnify:FL=1|jgi:small subunit ribosomal protein S7|nr:30S ribosomal protein S7 [Lentimicrobiaceae bacterium]MDG1135425.1 30S ribosomal protein S7 [Bacteroidales bacterium]MDG1902116.1 30S ribosomal protein S7 [Bacteroidales bacterium]MDG2080505.1 30S ribosomal protein S7 [Bacteroidales bacterium]|tara:strand:+ start:4583 stop:5050 length:468 start_codon:yes stop_codon:yes gene_type:complete
MRKAKPKIRIILPDPKYNDVLVTQFVNNMMFGGKKNTAYKLFYEAMDIVADKTSEDPVDVWKKALANVTPNVEVRSRRIGGATFQIPSEIRSSRKMSIGMKNLIGFSRKRHEKSMGKKLAGEILAAYKEEGSAFKKKEDTHRMAEANKAFSHFRF